MAYSFLENYYRLQRPIFITIALTAVGSFNFLFFSLVFVSWYHGVLAGAGTVLGILVVSAVYYFILWMSKLCAGNIIGNMADQIIYHIRMVGSLIRLLICE